MTTPGQIPFDPELLQRYSIIRRTPAWKDVAASMARLRELQRTSNPYDQMDLDRDELLSFYSNLRTTSDSIAWSICLAAHLARFSKSQASEQRLNEGFQALSTGIDLASLSDAVTATELQRCAQAAFSGLNLQFPPLAAALPPSDTAPARESAAPEQTPADAADASPGQDHAASPQPQAPPPPPADPWRTAVEAALSKIALMERPSMEDVIQRANEGWQNRIVGLLTSPDQPEISPDIDYLRCRAANHPLGMVLRGRLKNVSLREWNEVYMSGALLTGASTPVPLWFAVAALGALGFDVPREPNLFNSATFVAEGNEASTFAAKLPTASPRKGIAVIRLTADSQTAEWKINPSMPALILPAIDALRSGKFSPQKYFLDRLHGILVEVARGENPAAARTRAGINRLNEEFPNIRTGLLLLARTGGPEDLVGAAVKPTDAWDAYTQAFATTTTTAAAKS
jgi:hypothetical protein